MSWSERNFITKGDLRNKVKELWEQHKNPDEIKTFYCCYQKDLDLTLIQLQFSSSDHQFITDLAEKNNWKEFKDKDAIGEEE